MDRNRAFELEEHDPICRGVNAGKVPIHGSFATFLILAITVFGAYLRFTGARNVPYFEDDYTSALQTLGILRTGSPTMPSGLEQWAEPVALPYFVSALWRLTGPSILTGRFVSAGLGTLSIVTAFLLGSRLRGKGLGIIFAFLVATSLWSITSSTYFRSYASAELGFLVMCYLAVAWLKARRFSAIGLPIIAVAAITALVGHYLLVLVLPALLLLPLVARLFDRGEQRVVTREGGEGVSIAQGIRAQLESGKFIAVVTLVLGLSVGLITSVAVRYGWLIARGIGTLSREFFTILPDNAQITFRPFFVESLETSYGPLLLLVIAGAVVMLIQTGRCGSVILSMFAIPFVLLSTIFASLTITSMFDRYLFPFNPALLLMVAFVIVAVGEGLTRLVMRLPVLNAQSRMPFAGLLISLLLAFGVTATSRAFVLEFNAGTGATIEAWMRARNEPQTPSYHRAAVYLRRHLSPDDVVLGTRTVDLAFELPYAKGYWLAGNPKELLLAGIRTDRGVINRYTGYPAIPYLTQLLDTTDRANVVWLMVPYFHDNADSLTQPVWRFVHSQTNKVPAASDNTLSVFQWKPISFEVAPLKLAPQVYGNASDVLLLEDFVAQVRAHPGSVDWSGLQYRLIKYLPVPSRMAFVVSIRLNKASAGVKVIRFDLILEEEDGDRWHVPSLMTVPVGSGWQEFFFPFSDLQFWPLGRKTKGPDRITSIKVEAHKARDLAFVAEVKINVVERLNR